MKPFVLVAIPFKNKADLVINCLSSLLEYSYISGFRYSILLISDGSTQEEIEKITKSRFGKIVGILNYDNIGYTRIVYNVVEMVKEKNEFDYILLSNNDIKFFPSVLYSLVTRMKSNQNIAAVGCKVLHWTDDVIIHTGTRINPECENWIENPYCGYNINEPITKNLERRLWVNGCCALYNLSILRKENMNFDLTFSPAYFEECDLMTRLNIKGYSVLYEPRAIVRHKVNGTVNDYQHIYGPVFANNWKIYLEKWRKYFNNPILYFQR